jgi:hypothetical protein
LGSTGKQALNTVVSLIGYGEVVYIVFFLTWIKLSNYQGFFQGFFRAVKLNLD